MTEPDHGPPSFGPTSDPVMYGVAKGLAQLFPLIGPVQRDTEPSKSHTNPDTIEGDTGEEA